jgi:hypothetical protein
MTMVIFTMSNHTRKNGKPAAGLVRRRPQARSPRGILKGELFIIGDIIAPIDVEWDVLKTDPEVKPASDP